MGPLHKSPAIGRLLYHVLKGSRNTSAVQSLSCAGPSICQPASPPPFSTLSLTSASSLYGCLRGGRQLSSPLPFAASHVQQKTFPGALPEGIREASSVAATSAKLARPGAGTTAGVMEGLEMDEDNDEGVIGSGVGGPVSSSGSSRSKTRDGEGQGGDRKVHGKLASSPTQSPSELQSQVEDFLEKHDIRIEYSGTQGIPTPVLSMDQASFNSSIMNSIRRSGFSVPTPIQSVAWPVALEKHNLVGIASTGSGKTAAFLFPAMDMILNEQLRTSPKQDRASLQRSNKSSRSAAQPAVVVLVPTRELAMQVGEHAGRFGASLGIRSSVVYGGASRAGQLSELRMHKPPIIIATPGRLQDFVNEGAIDLSNVQYLALDEADRMLDMGFEPAVTELSSYMPKGTERQTMLFSATWPKEVRGLATDLLRGSRNPTMYLYVGNVQEELVASPTVQQSVVVLQSKGQKMDALLEFIAQIRQEEDLQAGSGSSSRHKKHPRVLVFVNTKNECEELASALGEEAGMPRISVIHGDKNQYQREMAISLFKSGRCPILVATDVAARGLDVPDVKAVVNWDTVAASRPQDYVHRIGRTGRAGAKGRALVMLVSKNLPDIQFAPLLIKIMSQSGQEVPQELHDLAAAGLRGRSFGQGSSRFQNRGSGDKSSYDRRGRSAGYSEGGRGGYGGSSYSRGGRNDGYREDGRGGFGRSSYSRGGRNDGYSEDGREGYGRSSYSRGGRDDGYSKDGNGGFGRSSYSRGG